MAEQVTNTAGLGSLSTVTDTLQGGLTNAISLLSNKFDQFFPTETREYWKGRATKFATEQPYLATFLLSQIALSGPAIVLFVILTITVVVFALLAGILVGLLGALLFIVFAVGFALLFLLPTLFFTTFAAVFIWLWGLAAYYMIKWFNQKSVPGIHQPLAQGLAEKTGLNFDSLSLPGKDTASADGAATGGKQQQQQQHQSNGPTPEKPQRKQQHRQHQNGEAKQRAKPERQDNEEDEGHEKENRPPKLEGQNQSHGRSGTGEKNAGGDGHVS